MSWIDVVIVVLVALIVICVFIKILLKKRLGSIDGMIVVTKIKEYNKIIGGNPANSHVSKNKIR